MSNTRASKKRSIGFKACEDEDADLISWWETMPKGVRSSMLRTLIRAAMQVELEVNQTQHTDLAQLNEDTAWLKQALIDLPGYLEAVIGRVAVTKAASAPNHAATESTVDSGVLDLRRQRLGKATW